MERCGVLFVVGKTEFCPVVYTLYVIIINKKNLFFFL
jgi:hypothetical protein